MPKATLAFVSFFGAVLFFGLTIHLFRTTNPRDLVEINAILFDSTMGTEETDSTTLTLDVVNLSNRSIKVLGLRNC